MNHKIEKMKTNKSVEMDYTQAMAELTALVKKWENDQPDLSQAATDLERAAFLVAFCRDYLRNVEQKIEEIGG